MITASAAFDVVIGSLSQTVAGQFTLGLTVPASYNFNQALTAIQLDAQNQTDLPDGIRDQAGFSTMGGTATFAGNVAPGVSVTDLLNPDNPASVLYRTQVKGTLATFSWGVQTPGNAAPELVRKFTGRVTTLTLDYAAGTVELGLTDMSVDWDSAPGSPAVITAPPYNAGLTSEFAMDAVIRSVNGTSTWPATRAKCVLAAGMRSSIWPEVGAIDPLGGNTALQVPTFTPGVFGTALLNNPAGLSGLYYDLARPVAPADSIFIEFWATGLLTVNVSDTLGGYGSVGVVLSVSSSTVSVLVNGASGGSAVTLSVANDGLPHYYAAAISWPAGSTAYTATIYRDGTATTLNGTAAQPRSTTATAPFATASFITASTTIEALQISTETAPASSYPFTPAAVLDPSLNLLTVVPAIDVGAQAVDVLQTIAAAELGYARMDENGVYRFSNRQTIANQAVQRTITSRVSLKTLTTYVGNGTQYHHVQVPYIEWAFGAPTNVFTIAAGVTIPPRQTTVWTQPMDTLAGNLDTAATLLPNGHTFADGGTWYRASLDPNGITAHPGITVSVAQISPGTIQITAVNTTSQTAYLVSPASYTDLPVGTPSLWVGGLPAMPAAEAFVDIVHGDGKGVYTFASNAYLQDAGTAKLVGYWLTNQLYTPVRDYTNVAIVPDSRIQIGDLDHLVDNLRGSGIDEYVFVWGWSFSAQFPQAGQSGGSWDETLSLRTMGPPGSWLGGVPGRSEAPTTTFAY